jgi:ABC-type nitrate/sulfonate/bicarbonate transport system substrate-binding protein
MFGNTLLRAALVILVGLALGGPSEAAPDSKTNSAIRISYGMLIDDLPFYVAMEENFWEQEGIKVELVRLVGETNIMAAALKGDIQGGHIDYPAALQAALKNLPIKVTAWFGRAHQGTRCGIHVDAKSDIHSVADMKGKRLAMSGSITAKMFYQELLVQNALKPEDIQAIMGIKLDDAMKHEAALRSKGVDAIVA